MTRWPVRARLTAGYLAVLGLATMTLAAGTWWLFRTSIVQAADAALVTRLDGTRRFIEAAQLELPDEDVPDEFQEFAELTNGETLLEVTDDTGRTLCRPVLAGWFAVTPPVSVDDRLNVVPIRVDGEPFRAVATDLVVGGRRYRVVAAIPMGTTERALARFSWLLAGLVPIVLVAAGAGGYWLSRRALSPVDRMTRDVRALSPRHLDRRIAVPPADDELQRLASTFNDLLARHQRAFDDVVRFTADASHELRTPVSLARTTAELALTRSRSADQYREAIGNILTQTERMSTLVNDLLRLARADAGVEPPADGVVDLRDAARAAVDELKGLAAARGVTLSTTVGEDPLPVRTSLESLRRLTAILVDNALRYTPAGGTVVVGAARAAPGAARGAHVTLEVVDTGPGVALEERVRVFDRFYRGEAARTAAPDGAGLGLAIARTLVDRLGGVIDLDDAPGGRGCRVRVDLPTH